ncbi:hypothetical protein HRED_09957, partial [Candidatus Haloredivivus sp. G17]
MDYEWMQKKEWQKQLELMLDKGVRVEQQALAAIIKAFQNAEEKDTTVHLAGIISDGGIHGHIDHLKALMRIASDYDVDVEIHCFADGRDVDPKSAEEYISQIK